MLLTHGAYRRHKTVNPETTILAARLIIKYEDDYPLHVETQKDFDVVCNGDTDAFCQGIN